MPGKAKIAKGKSGQASARLELDFPPKLVTEPILYDLVKKFDLVPNIRRANITQKFGYIQLELRGTAQNLEQGIKFLIKKGVQVEPIVKDVLES
jgi:L-aspartate semialdehyde sulfurtransferase ferredoxin